MQPRSAAAAAFFLLTAPCAAIATETPGAQLSQPVAQSETRALITRIEEAFRKSYVFPDKVPAIVARLEASLQQGRYRGAGPNALATLVTSDLQQASRDGHAYLVHDPERFRAAVAEAAAPADQITPVDLAIARRDNHGLVDMRILGGNVRYLRISAFRWTGEESARAYDDAMRFLRGGDARVIDLRGNGGGDPEAEQYLASHFLMPGTLELTVREAGHPALESRALDKLPAGRLIGKPLYVLVDQSTGSAAEAFAYDVRQFRLGKLVGTRTAGAANRNDFVPIEPGFVLSVSTATVVHAVSKSNWEGTGVAPDLAASSPAALAQAHVTALQALMSAAPDELRKADYAWALRQADAELRPVDLPSRLLRTAPGKYGDYALTAADGALRITGPGHFLWFPRHLTPLDANGLFAIDGVDRLRVRIVPGALELWSKGQQAPELVKRG